MTRIDTIERPYSPEDVERLRGSVTSEHTLARRGAERLRQLLAEDEWVPALGAMTVSPVVLTVNKSPLPTVNRAVGVESPMPTRSAPAST